MLTPFYNNWIYRAEMNPHNFHSNRRSNTQAPCALVGMVGKSKCTYIYIYMLFGPIGLAVWDRIPSAKKRSYFHTSFSQDPPKSF